MRYKRGHNYPGLLITFDGRDWSGKSTQQKKFSEYLRYGGYREVESKDPVEPK